MNEKLMYKLYSVLDPIFHEKEMVQFKETGCWEWSVKDKANGYGVLTISHKSHRAHRWIYEKLVGPIKPPLVLDHLCKNKICVNPEHLEPVTTKTNTLRGISFSAQNAKKLFCPKGHPYSGKNLLKTKTKTGVERRHCRECMRANHRDYMRNRRAAFASADKAQGGKEGE